MDVPDLVPKSEMTLEEARRTYAESLAHVPTRDELPHVLNSRNLLGLGVEVGVQTGVYSEHLLRFWKGSCLFSVDPWLEQETGDYTDIANVRQSKQDFNFKITTKRLARYPGRSTILRLTSEQAASHFPLHSLDFVYLDARHDYESVRQDLHLWFDKLRPGGIFAGHDYLNGLRRVGIFGVKSAVDEFFGERGLLVFPTFADAPYVSWMVEIPFPSKS